MSNLVLNVERLSYRYDNARVLENISFSLHRGEMMGLVGPNGSGKSTLLKLILGILPVQAGSVEWFGQSHRTKMDSTKIGYVSQKANSFNAGFPATAGEVVMMGLTSKLGLFRRPEKIHREKVREALASVGMDDFVHRNIGRLSGGQQQRIFIARAIVSEPEVLILDEPTVGVDAHSEAQFYELLQKLNREMNLSILLVSHDLGAISKKMNTIACLNRELHFHGEADEFERRRPEILLRSYGHDVHVLTHGEGHGS